MGGVAEDGDYETFLCLKCCAFVPVDVLAISQVLETVCPQIVNGSELSGLSFSRNWNELVDVVLERVFWLVWIHFLDV